MVAVPREHRGATAKPENIAGQGFATMPRGGQPAAFAMLNGRQRRLLGRQHRDLAGFAAAIVVVCRQDAEGDITAMVGELVDTFNRGEQAHVEEIVERTLSRREARPQVIETAARQARFRTNVLRDYGAYTAAEIADRNGSTSTDRSKLASQWRARGRVFAVPYNGARLYLKFQFDEVTRPLPVLSDILRQFNGWDPWEKAAWFVTPNGLLQQRRPAELLRNGRDDVVHAALMDPRIRPKR